MVSKSPISWEIKRQVNQNVGLRHYQTRSAPAILTFYGYLTFVPLHRIQWYKGLNCLQKKSLMIYHLISQNGKHVPKTAQPSPDWPPLSGLVSIIRQFPRKKGTLAVRQGERVSTNMM